MSISKVDTLLIRTPEGICFSILLAGPVTRFLAWIIDFACISVTSNVIGSFLAVLGFISLDFAQAVIILAYFIISISYGIVLEWFWRGQTLGKRLLRLRVVDEQGLRLQFSQIVIRNLLRFVDMLPMFYLVGGIACLTSSRAQRLGDFAANTVVIRNPQIVEPDLNQLALGKFNSLREYPHLEARLRQRVSPQEAGLALQALLRREELDPVARVDLFNEIAGHFASVVKFPEDATYGITDEQYVRNVVEVLFRPRSPEHRSHPERSKSHHADLNVTSSSR